MPTGPAARVGDPVAHPLPPVLQPGPGSLNVLIGGLPAWRGVGGAAAATIMAAKAGTDATVHTAEAITAASAGTPAAPGALAAEQSVRVSSAATMSATISAAAGAADIHACGCPPPPTPLPPHGPGVVTTGSLTVLINGLPACRAGDTITEAAEPNAILMGLPTVIIGG